MKLLSLVVLLLVALIQGCATQHIPHVGDRQKSDVRKVLSADFKFTPGREDAIYSLLVSALGLIDRGEKVESVVFSDSTHATVYLSPPEYGIHGGPFFSAVWDRGEWKFGGKWSLI